MRIIVLHSSKLYQLANPLIITISWGQRITIRVARLLVLRSVKLNHTCFHSLPSGTILMLIMESQDKVVVNALADNLWGAFQLRTQQLTQSAVTTVKRRVECR